jgi:hypothetical protein
MKTTFILFLLVAAGCENTAPGGAQNPIGWETREVSLTADDFHLSINDQNMKFFANVPSVNVLGSCVDPERCSLQVYWSEHQTPMRVVMEFESDGQNWSAYEIKTYDGRRDPEWINYVGIFFTSPMGTAFSGDVDLQSWSGTGTLHFGGLRLQAFR